jgi:hypothetical protein
MPRCRRHGPFSGMTPRRSMSANGGGADLIVPGTPSTEGCVSWRPLSFRTTGRQTAQGRSFGTHNRSAICFHGYIYLSGDDSRFSSTASKLDAYCAGTDFIQKLKLLFRSVAVLGSQSLQHIFVARRVSLPFELRRAAFANRDNDSPRWLTASGQFS